jgi:predicted methyltransferase
MSMKIRRPLVLSLAVALALSACAEPPAPPAAPAPPVEPVAPVATPAPPPVSVAPSADAALDAALAATTRTPEFVARDAYRHPRESLTFFGIAPTQTVIEITPGGGWYSEILAPYLRDGGQYIGAVVNPATASNDNARSYYTKGNEELRAKFTALPTAFDKAVLVEFDPAAPVFGGPNSADLVLTFRNVHNWMGNKQAEGMFKGFFDVLKPGGTLGVVEHRANADVPEGDRSGYVSENQVIALATAAGFVLDGRSEVNANPKDTKDHPNGVWTLPPVSRVPEGGDAQKYKDIGESDRMTLKFIKPDAAPAPAAG